MHAGQTFKGEYESENKVIWTTNESEVASVNLNFFDLMESY